MRVKVNGYSVILTASEDETSEFARTWPCSKLSGLAFSAEFHDGDLVDTNAPENVEATEFNAFLSWAIGTDRPTAEFLKSRTTIL